MNVYVNAQKRHHIIDVFLLQWASVYLTAIRIRGDQSAMQVQVWCLQLQEKKQKPQPFPERFFSDHPLQRQQTPLSPYWYSAY